MPKFKKNTSPAMKRSGFKMAGYTYPGTSPVQKGKIDTSYVKPEEITLEEFYE